MHVVCDVFEHEGVFCMCLFILYEYSSLIPAFIRSFCKAVQFKHLNPLREIERSLP